MIHRPPDEGFVHYSNMQESEPSGSWVIKILAFLALGAAMSAILSRFNGWSTHSHND